MNELESMRILTEIVEQESFAKAARNLRISPAKASMKIAALEDHLGAQLLIRTTRHVQLSEEGKIYHARALKILADVKAVGEDIRALGDDEPHGRLRVAATTAMVSRLILPILGEFQEKYPRVDFEFPHSDKLYGAEHEDCDVMMRLGPLRDSSIIARRLRDVTLMIAASPEYLAKWGEPSTPADLANHRCIITIHPKTGLDQRWWFQKDGKRVAAAPGRGPAFADSEHRVTAGVRGLGIFQGATFGLEDLLASGALKPILTDWQVTMGMYLAYPATRHLLPKSRAFIDFLLAAYPYEGDGQTLPRIGRA